MKRLLIILLLISNIGWSQSAEKKTVQSVSKYSVPLDKNTKERTDTETTSTGSNQDSFNYYYSQYLNSESSNKDYQSLLSAYRMNPNYSELYFEMAKYYELSNETLNKRAFCEKLKATKLTPSLREYAYNTLMSVEQNGILVTYGENDTYPIWVLQTIEGIRTDIKILNFDLMMNQTYRTRIAKEFGLNFAKSYSKNINILADVATRNSSKPIYFALTVSHLVLKDLKKNLFSTGLAFKYSKSSFNNIPLLKQNWESKFTKNYVSVTFNPALSRRMNLNYVLPMIQLAEYYKENNMESQYQSIKLKILAIAKNAGREEQIKKMLND